MGFCYRPPEQQEKVDEISYRQHKAALESETLVLVGDFNYPDICWRSSTAKHK